ncbi:MAG: 30S ribosomal protein S7 [Candidatus Levybacteria bacterium]|nr:30S ribosomal protein S7 [Candidatus Levybacteria bacterium]
MRHAHASKKRHIEGDAVYNNVLVAKLANYIMKDGKKSVAQKIVYDMMDILAKNPLAGTGSDGALNVFEKAVQNIGPKTEIKARRVGGASYQIPIEVRGDRRTALALRWIVDAARAKSSKDFHTFAEKLASEILAAAENQGEAVKKRDNVHRMADANKAFSHFRI